jgi:hypothetical protein
METGIVSETKYGMTRSTQVINIKVSKR